MSNHLITFFLIFFNFLIKMFFNKNLIDFNFLNYFLTSEVYFNLVTLPINLISSLNDEYLITTKFTLAELYNLAKKDYKILI